VTLRGMVAAVLALAAAGCGGQGPPPQPPPAPWVEACTLLTDAQVSRALGGGAVVHQGSFDIEGVSSTCVYRTQGRNRHDYLVLAVYPRESSGDFARLVAGAQPVPGLGDQAAWQGNLGQVRELHVRVGAQMLSLTSEPGTTEATLVSLGRAALPRLRPPGTHTGAQGR
jgi:hypothetical protein